MKRSGRKSMGSAKTSGLRWTRGAAMPTGVWNAGQNIPKSGLGSGGVMLTPGGICHCFLPSL